MLPAFALGLEAEGSIGHSQFSAAGLPSSYCQAAQDSLRWRSSKLLGLQGGIPSLGSHSGEKGILKRHSPAERNRCWWLRCPAWAKCLLFPELSAAADCTVEAVSCLQQSCSSALACTALPAPHRQPCLPGPAAGPAAAAERPSDQLQSAEAVWHPPVGAGGSRLAWLVLAGPSSSSSQAQSPAMQSTPRRRGKKWSSGFCVGSQAQAHRTAREGRSS